MLSDNREAMAKLSTPDLMKILAATLSGITVDQFNAEVKKWLASAKHPRWNRPYQWQEFDKGQCYSWAVQRTVFDPANPQVAQVPPPPVYPGQPQAPQGGMYRGAAGGAALGAIGGDAGKGAAIGAGVGAPFGGMRRMRYMEEEQQMQQQGQQQQMYMAQQQNSLAQGRANILIAHQDARMCRVGGRP